MMTMTKKMTMMVTSIVSCEGQHNPQADILKLDDCWHTVLYRHEIDGTVTASAVMIPAVLRS
jgi:hypothetical protein